MIKRKVFVFNPFQENTFVLSDETGECVIVDAGCINPAEEKQLEGYISAEGLKPVALVNTHCHVDHVFGNAFVHRKYGLSTRCHSGDVFLLEGAASHAAMFGMEMDAPPAPGDTLADGDTINFGKSFLRVIHVPGHSPGGIALHAPDDKFLLAGDSLFRGGIGRTDLPGGDYEGLIEAIRNKLFLLDADTEVYPGHGPATTIGTEKSTNPFFL